MSAEGIKPLRVELRVRNNVMIRLREEMGFTSASAFCKAAKINYEQYNALENMRSSPIYPDTERRRKLGYVGWTSVAREIAAFHGVDLATLWPDAVLRMRKVFSVGEFDENDIRSLGSSVRALQESPEEAVEVVQLQSRVRRVLSTLTPREEKVIRMRFGIGEPSDRTLEEIGEKFHVTRERTRMIEAKALRKLRHPARSKMLRDFADLTDNNWSLPRTPYDGVLTHAQMRAIAEMVVPHARTADAKLRTRGQYLGVPVQEFEIKMILDLFGDELDSDRKIAFCRACILERWGKVAPPESSP